MCNLKAMKMRGQRPFLCSVLPDDTNTGMADGATDNGMQFLLKRGGGGDSHDIKISSSINNKTSTEAATAPPH